MARHKVQKGIWSVVYNVVEQVMLDLLCKEVICETLDTKIAKCFDMEAATDRLSKRILTSSLFVLAFATFMRRKTDSTIADKGNAAAKA